MPYNSFNNMAISVPAELSVYVALDNIQLSSSKYQNIRILFMKKVYIIISLQKINCYFLLALNCICKKSAIYVLALGDDFCILICDLNGVKCFPTSIHIPQREVTDKDVRYWRIKHDAYCRPPDGPPIYILENYLRSSANLSFHLS